MSFNEYVVTKDKNTVSEKTRKALEKEIRVIQKKNCVE